MALGEIIAGPEWLFLACHHSRTSAAPARQIYRAFVLHRKRTGHVLDLDAEPGRRQVEWGLRKGRVQHFLIPCVRCGCDAWLDDWVRSADYSEAQREAILDDNPEHAAAGRLDFLKRCQGGSYKRVVHTNRDWPEVL